MKKKLPALLLSLCLLFLAGCSQTVVSTPTLPGEYPMNFLFSSGAGAWGTRLYLNADGSFQGQFSDTNMGETGEGYPNGTVYLCSFTGRFSLHEKLDAYSYPLTLEEVSPDLPIGEEQIKAGILYVNAGPYGLYNDNIEGDGAMSRSFVLYTPDTPVSGLDEELLSWWPGRYEQTPPETLNCYALYNVEAGIGFFTDLPIAN